MMFVMAEWLGQTGRAGALLALMLALSWLLVAPFPYTSALAADNARPQADAGPTQAPLGDQDEAAQARLWQVDKYQREEMAQQEMQAGSIALFDKDFASAEEHFRKALEILSSPAAYLGLIETLNALGGRDKEADKLWVAVLEQFANDRDVIAANGERLYRARQFRAALEVLQRGLDHQPGDPRLLCAQAACYERLGDKAKAVQAYADALGSEYSAVAVARMANAVGEESGYAAGEMVWEKYIAMHPDDAQLRFYHAFAGKNDVYHPEITRAELERAVKLDPAVARYYGDLGLCCSRMQDYASAEKAYRQALAIDPLPDYYIWRAHALHELDRTAEAVQCLSEGLALNPGDRYLSLEYGQMLILAGQATAGLKYLTDAGEKLKDSEILRLAGARAIEQHDAAAAERAYVLLETGFPQDAACDTTYLAYQLAKGKQAALVALLESIKSLSDPASLHTSNSFYGCGIERLGKVCRSVDDAQQVFEPLIQGDAANPLIYSAYTACLLRIKQFEDALAVVRRGLNDAGKHRDLKLLEAQCVIRTSGIDPALPLLKALISDAKADAGTYIAVILMLPPETELARIEGLAMQGAKLFPKDAPGMLYALAQAYYVSGDYVAVLRTLADPACADRDYFFHEEQIALLFYDKQLAMLGRAYLHLGNYLKAIANLKNAWLLFADEAQLHADLARAYYFLGEMNLARQAVSKAQTLQPDLASAHVWLGFVQLSAGEVEAARQAFGAVQSDLGASKEDMAWGALGRARVALMAGDQQAARIALSEATAYGVKDGALQAEIKATRKDVQQ